MHIVYSAQFLQTATCSLRAQSSQVPFPLPLPRKPAPVQHCSVLTVFIHECRNPCWWAFDFCFWEISDVCSSVWQLFFSSPAKVYTLRYISHATWVLHSPLSKLVDRAVYFTCINFFLFLVFARSPIISGSTGPIFHDLCTK